ncbi:unnamed protein product [Brassica napus]|uniref:(rape) hypothetical protein n=1 Tax=Brassica napus TaxID=3708 RepID=A0A816SF60_BRANA|nr:unnamed protein product [Brassica napus]
MKALVIPYMLCSYEDFVALFRFGSNLTDPILIFGSFS